MLAHPVARFVSSFEDSLPFSVQQQVTSTDGTDNTEELSIFSLRQSAYVANVTEEDYPNSTLPQSRPMVLSLFVEKSNFTDPILNATITCLANDTGVDAVRWGLWELSKFTSDMMQAGLFVNVPEVLADGSFVESLKEYVTLGNRDGLASCVRNSSVGFSAEGQFYMAREPEDRADISYSSVAAENGGTPSWVPALIVGVLGLAGLVGFLVVKVGSRKKRYDPTDYAENMPLELDEVVTPEQLEDRELAIMADGR